MRLIITLILMLTSFTTFVSAEESPRFLGLGVLVSTQPYHGLQTKKMVAPFIAWDYKKFYVRGIESGYKFFDSNDLSLSVIVVPRLMGYDAEDADVFAGMADRRLSVDGGFKAVYTLPRLSGVSINALAVNDLLSRHDGRQAELSLAKDWNQKYLRLKGSLGMRLYSSSLQEYYFGVTSAEATINRPSYTPGHALQPFVGLTLITGFSKDWMVLARVGGERLDTGVRKSPLVEDRYTVSGALGFARRF